ncbi:nucleotide-binding alpha-beta plait domain-containing protein [Artemisia annua]|uniref:Nucleotide-binding alpha-beta plait domain-containing protein n=1 Tax=Artemisia annua TaxID=35608 RepID=A0A2U1L2V9_ARTAN|nr:nucleotide-binding alpha-beta plait domain-containing protein [Artemisia annua]
MEEEWSDVPTRRNKGRQNHKGHVKGVRDVTKFFVSNLPSGCTSWEVTEFLGYYGEVVGSYIAKKRERKEIGSGLFRLERYVVEMEKRMNGIKIGSCRLKVNVAKFAVENVGLKELEERAGRKQDKHERLKDWKQDKQEVDWAVLNGKSSKDSSAFVEPGSRSIKVPDNVVAFYEIRGRALIGRVRNLRTLTCMKQLCEENMVGGFNIVYVGGLSLLLNFNDKEDAVEMMLKKEVWSKWFSVLDFWEGQPMPFERVAWLKIHGVPINLATNEVFDDVASLFGKIVHPSQLSLDDGDISVGFVGILVGDGKIINESVDLKWTNKVFKTWITEEKGNWEPECVGVVGKKVVVANDVPVDYDGDSSPVKIHVSMSEEEREINETSEAVLEEGELREPMHGEVGGIKFPHVISQGVSKDKAASMSGDEEEVEKFNDTIIFKSSKCGPKPKKRPIKLCKKRSQRVQNINSSPSDVVRPKKRCRNEDNDPFDLDRLIGIFHNEEGIEGDSQSRSAESLRQSVDGGSLDLNCEASAPESAVEGSGAVEQVVDEGDSLVQEVEATVIVGAVLGADLAGHEGLVRNAIVEEGINGVKS